MTTHALSTGQRPDPTLQKRIDDVVSELASVVGPVPPERWGVALAFIAHAASEEVGVPVVVTYTPRGLVGYAMPTHPIGTGESRG